MDTSAPFHTLTTQETEKRLHTSPEGLSEEEVAKRKALFGKNVIKEEKVSKLLIFFRQFNNIFFCILFAASLISISIGEWTDFCIINFIILINGMIGFWQELKAAASIAALKKLTESRNKVMRNGQLQLICSSEIVPGDYLILHEGEVVTADIRLVESTGLMVDESSITGESMPVVKDHTLILPESSLVYELKNSLLAGTCIVRGAGQGIVVKTGAQTYLASIAEKAVEASPDTPLTRSLSFFAKRYIVFIVVLFSLLGILGYFQGRLFVELAYILLASLVSAVPEGLPIVTTLVMVIGAIALSKKQALVRYLPSVETLGSATVIASDKTGTITEGKLIVKEVFSPNLDKLRLIASLCNDSHEGSGDPLDVALSGWAENFDALQEKHPRSWAYSFDTQLMLMATVNEIEGKKVLLVKGAYESLREKAINQTDLKEMDAAFERFVNKGLRVLSFGMGSWTGEDPDEWTIQIIGLIGFLDPPKKGVREAAEHAKKAGIRLLLITGDHPMTAVAVAKEVGIYQENEHELLTGKEIETMSDKELLFSLKTTTVLARILPEHKYRIVKLLQEAGEIVAFTGDGVNDVPALKTADIGIAMGGGTEAAKTAAKMVITDNNLRVIVDAIRNARVIADNVRKVIYYFTSTSILELTIISCAIFTSHPLPLAAIQILWINIITGGVQDKTFAFAKAEGNVMLKKPKRPEKQFFDAKQIIHVFAFGVPMGMACFFLYLFLLDKYPFTTVSTLIFTSSIAAQLADGIQAQKDEEPFFKNIKTSFTINPSIYFASLLGIVLQCFALYVIPQWFHSVSISLSLWKYPLFSFVCSFLVIEARKWIEFFLMTKKV